MPAALSFLIRQSQRAVVKYDDLDRQTATAEARGNPHEHRETARPPDNAINLTARMANLRPNSLAEAAVSP